MSDLHGLIATYIRHWGPESPDEPGAADYLADRIIADVQADRSPLLDRIASALERLATIAEQSYLDERGQGARLPKVRGEEREALLEPSDEPPKDWGPGPLGQQYMDGTTADSR